MKKNINIELVGMPGTGKTTLSKQLLNYYKDNFSVAEPTNQIESTNTHFRKIYKLYLILKFSLRHPIMLIKTLKKVIETDQKSIIDFAIVFINFIFIISLYKDEKKIKDVSIYDQGFFQAIWAILFSSNIKKNQNIKKFKSIVNNVYSNNREYIVIYLQNDIEKLKALPRRTDKKGRYEKSFSENKNEKLIKKYFFMMKLIEEELISFEKEGKINLICIDYNELYKIDSLIYEIDKVLYKNKSN